MAFAERRRQEREAEDARRHEEEERLERLRLEAEEKRKRAEEEAKNIEVTAKVSQLLDLDRIRLPGLCTCRVFFAVIKLIYHHVKSCQSIILSRIHNFAAVYKIVQSIVTIF